MSVSVSVSVEECPRVESPVEPRTVVLNIPKEVRLKISPEDFWTLCTQNRLPRLERTAEGELVVMSPAGYRTSSLELKVGAAVLDWAQRNRNGCVAGSNGGFTLPNGAVRAADVSWVAEERWKALTKKQRSVFAPITPDFVIEICSPSDNRNQTRAKMVEYLEQGVRLGWLIDARTPEFEVEIHRRGQAVETLSKPQTVSGDDVLPGFILELGKILAEAP